MISQPVSSIFFLFSTALWDLAHSRPVHFLMLSSHLFFCLPCLLPAFTGLCKMVFARPDERATCPYHCSLHKKIRIIKRHFMRELIQRMRLPSQHASVSHTFVFMLLFLFFVYLDQYWKQLTIQKAISGQNTHEYEPDKVAVPRLQCKEETP